MSDKIKIYLLCYRYSENLYDIYKLFTDYEQAYNKMETQYNEALDDFNADGGFKEDETEIENDKASVVGLNKWEQWNIYDVELEINNFKDFISVFDIFLNYFNREYIQFISGDSEITETTKVLLKTLNEFKNKISSAVPADKEG